MVEPRVILRITRNIYIYIMFFFLPLALFAAATAEDSGENVVDDTIFQRQRRMLFLFDAPEDFSEYEKFFIYNSVLAAISRASPEVVILESEEVEVPAVFEDRQLLVRESDADSWVFVQVQGDRSNTTFYYETFDLLTLTTYGETTIETGLRIDLRTISRGTQWDGLAKTIRDNYFYLIDREDVSINAPPGAVITGLSSDEIIIDESGNTVVSLFNPAIYNYHVDLNGHYSIEEEFYLGFTEFDLEIDPIPTINFALELSFNSFQFLGFQAYWYPVPANWFVGLGFTTYSLGLYLVNDTPDLVRSNPLTTIKLQSGIYLFDEINLLRPYISLGAGLRIVHIPDDPDTTAEDGIFEINKATPLEISLALGVELSLDDRFVRVFAEYVPVMFISSDIEEFRDASFLNYLYSSNEIPGYTFLENLAFDFRNFAVGMRFTF